MTRIHKIHDYTKKRERNEVTMMKSKSKESGDT